LKPRFSRLGRGYGGRFHASAPDIDDGEPAIGCQRNLGKNKGGEAMARMSWNRRSGVLSAAIGLLSATALTAGLPHGAAASDTSDTWLACSGSVLSVDTSGDKPVRTTESSQRVLVLDDAKNNLYQYSEDKNALSVILTQSYTPAKITWGADMSMTSGMTWEATLDRTKMDLKMVRDAFRERNHMTWTEKCQPTQPRAVGTNVVASN
jgi:hypothetical protein